MLGVESKIDGCSDDSSALEQTETARDAPHMLGHRSLKRLIDFLFLSPNQVMPSERAFAENLILRNFDTIPDNILERLAQRLAASKGIAPSLSLKLAECGRIEISGPILRDGELADIDIADLARNGSTQTRMVIAMRTKLSSIVSDILIDIAEKEVSRTVLLNTGARLSGSTLNNLILRAKSDPGIQKSLLIRPEITAATAMDLFWYVPGEVREYILLTFLCDQQSLTGILYDDVAWQEDQKTLRPAREGDKRIKSLTKLLIGTDTRAAIEQLAHDAHIAVPTATRILEDDGGEAFLVAAKAMGASRAGLNEALMRFTNAKSCIIGSTERLDPLRGLFDRMSRGQALVALQYWNLALGHVTFKA